MKGATAEPCVKKISALSRTSMSTMGVNHHFFRTLKNAQNSDSKYTVELLMTRCLLDVQTTRTLRRSQALEHCGNGFQQNLQIEPERPLIDILHVELHPFLELNVAPPVYLPQAGDPRS